MSTEKARSGETSAKLSPGKSGEFCLMCGADIETMFVPGWNGNKFCRDCYYPPAKCKLLDAERRIGELKRILKADCVAWGGKEADRLGKRIAELDAENDDLKGYQLQYRNNEMFLLGNIAKLESALAEETRLKCEYYAQWQQAQRERDQLAVQLADARHAIKVAIQDISLGLPDFSIASVLDNALAQLTPAAAQPSMYPWMEGEDKPAAALEEHDRAIYAEVKQERDRQDKQWGGPVHDDKHSWYDWTDYINHQLMLFRGLQYSHHKNDRRERFVKIAALAIAAVESLDRREFGLEGK